MMITETNPVKRNKITKSIIGYTTEPKPVNSTKLELIILLNYYANTYDFEKSKEYLLKNPDFRDFSEIDAQYFKNYGFLNRILLNGFVDTDGLIQKHLEKAKNDLSRIKIRNQIKKQETKDNRKTWKIKKEQGLREIGSIADQLIDNIFKNRKTDFESVKEEFETIQSKEGLQSVYNAAQRILKRIDSEIAEKDSTQCYKRGFLNKCRGQMLVLLEKCQERQKEMSKTDKLIIRHANTKKRKSPIKKTKPVSKVKKVSKLKYQPYHDVLGDSRGAVTIIGAHEYFVYDGKFLRYYIAEKDKTLDVSGTTILNFDSEKSCMKNIRKIDYIKNIMGISKAEKKKLFNAIKAVEKPVNGRMNENCFLIYV